MATSSHRTWWIPLLLALALSFAIALSACGGGDDDDDNGNTTATATAEGDDDGGDDGDEPTETEEPEPTEDNGDDGGGSGDIDACALLTTDEVAELIDETNDGLPTVEDDTFSCFWANPNDDPSVVVARQVLIVVNRGTFDSGYLIGGDPVENLGDEAVYNSEFAIVDVIQGEFMVQVSYIGDNETSPTEQQLETLALAEKVLDRLPD